LSHFTCNEHETNWLNTTKESSGLKPTQTATELDTKRSGLQWPADSGARHASLTGDCSKAVDASGLYGLT